LSEERLDSGDSRSPLQLAEGTVGSAAAKDVRRTNGTVRRNVYELLIVLSF
jgi:hypothetical protein